jgi:hypothetical protein
MTTPHWVLFTTVHPYGGNSKTSLLQEAVLKLNIFERGDLFSPK